MNSEYKEDWKEYNQMLQDFRTRYNYIGMLHFTDFSNLKNIVNMNALVSRAESDRNNMLFKDIAEQSVINHTSDFVKRCNRFYYRCLTPTLFRNEGIKVNNENPHVPIPVYLVFKDEIAFLRNSYYSNGNAGKVQVDIGNDINFFKSMDWENVFSIGPMIEEDKRYIIDKRNSELLIDGKVDLSLIDKIVFRCECDKKRFINNFGQKFKIEVNSKMFNNINNYIVDYKIIKKDGTVKLLLKFNLNNAYEYKHRYVIIKNGIVLEENCLEYNGQYGLIWNVNIGNYTEAKLEYYLNGILSIEEYLN